MNDPDQALVSIEIRSRIHLNHNVYLKKKCLKGNYHDFEILLQNVPRELILV